MILSNQKLNFRSLELVSIIISYLMQVLAVQSHTGMSQHQAEFMRKLVHFQTQQQHHGHIQFLAVICLAVLIQGAIQTSVYFISLIFLIHYLEVIFIEYSGPAGSSNAAQNATVDVVTPFYVNPNPALGDTQRVTNVNLRAIQSPQLYG